MLALALDPVWPNPARAGSMKVRFTIRSVAPASIELLDVSGRRLTARDLGTLAAGRHAIDIGEGVSLQSGIYFVRLTQGPHSRVTRVAVLD